MKFEPMAIRMTFGYSRAATRQAMGLDDNPTPDELSAWADTDEGGKFFPEGLTLAQAKCYLDVDGETIIP